ncbi:hypothetical protein BDY17DRAFT_324626 [Neohortaea acidophila]|uniref:Uncharacterized protein n=1 Tax=Neohortaea acidophila TaxID=245834 RepID=A0A6A6PSY5_9PEZI|nr:uncharacterized protein BDY17DRAFT_324626 [Neohortaea acidophila]KAF2482337.1 hypothetical protein BDY17DRAFT_324626 [Neohortaea acidophila]
MAATTVVVQAGLKNREATDHHPDAPHVTTTYSPEAERAVRDAITAAGAKNVELLHEISTTGDAVHELKANDARLSSLADELKKQSKAAREAATLTQDQLAKYTSDKESFGKRWAYILVKQRKVLEEKIRQGEQVYLQALGAQQRAEARETQLLRDKNAIEAENVEVKEKVKRHGVAHAALDALYEELFDGPTPGFPDEDEREAAFKSTKKEHDGYVATFRATVRATKENNLVKSTIGRARAENNRARSALQNSFISGVDTALVFLERTARLIEQTLNVNLKIDEGLPRPLDTAFNDNHVAVAQHLIKARTALQEPLEVSYAYITNTQCNRVIQDVEDELKLASEAQAVLTKLLKHYEDDAIEIVKSTARSLEDARQGLAEIRQMAFEVIVGHGSAAPNYHECCDRAASFVQVAGDETARMPDPVIDDSGLPPPPSYEASIFKRRGAVKGANRRQARSGPPVPTA